MRLRQELNHEPYMCKLLDLNDDHWLVDPPLQSADQPPLQISPNQSLWVEYQAKDGSLCRFHGQVLGMVHSPVPAWQIAAPHAKDIIREQRREFVRVPANIPVRLEWQNGEQRRQDDVFTRDISGGGVAVLIPREVRLHPGMIVRALFTLPNNHFPVDVECKVIRVSDRNDRGYAMASMQFCNIKESVRQRIIQYTFQRQRALM
jgi:c-di-GMP-binding flagellar brake protein YcgR